MYRQFVLLWCLPEDSALSDRQEFVYLTKKDSLRAPQKRTLSGSSNCWPVRRESWLPVSELTPDNPETIPVHLMRVSRFSSNLKAYSSIKADYWPKIQQNINYTGLNKLIKEILLWLCIWNIVDIVLMFYFLNIWENPLFKLFVTQNNLVDTASVN